MKTFTVALFTSLLLSMSASTVVANDRPSPEDISEMVNIMIGCGDNTAKMSGFLMWRTNGFSYDEVLELIPEGERRLEEDNLYRAYSIDLRTFKTEEDVHLEILMDYSDCIEQVM